VTDVVTGDAVVLDVSAAAFPSRMAARLIDMIIQLIALGLGFFVIFEAIGVVSADAVLAIVTVSLVLVIVGYPTIFETLSRGKTLGKMALGLRVVADDGSAVRFRQALIRALAGIFEIWILPLAPVALITSMVSAKGKRLGDMFAGTYVIQERMPQRRNLPPEFAVVPPPLAGWSMQLELSGLSDRDAEAAGSYLRRFYDLRPAARDALGLQLAATIAAQVSPPPPPGTPPTAFLVSVLAVRRYREHARLSGQPTAPGASTAPPQPPFAPPPATPPPAAPPPAAPPPAAPTEAAPPAGPTPATPAPAAPTDAPPPAGHAPATPSPAAPADAPPPAATPSVRPGGHAPPR
jgi:uncharacterized RDD family membrane protein YckC